MTALWSPIFSLHYGGDRKYVESLCHCESWAAGGGKSGAGFMKTQDERFIAKAIPLIELQMFFFNFSSRIF